MANAPLLKLLPKTVDAFKVFSAVQYVVTVNGNNFHNTVSVKEPTLALSNAQTEDGTDQTSYILAT